MFWGYSILVWSAPYWVLGGPMCLVPSCGKVQQSGSWGSMQQLCVHGAEPALSRGPGTVCQPRAAGKASWRRRRK